MLSNGKIIRDCKGPEGHAILRLEKGRYRKEHLMLGRTVRVIGVLAALVYLSTAAFADAGVPRTAGR